jgi:hypothetical protein
MGTFRCEYVRCGKPTCKSCPHGPYWYEYWREGDKVHKRYHGKVDPRPKAKGKPGKNGGAKLEEAHPWDAIFCRQTASSVLAATILGLTGGESFEDARRIFGRLVMQHHPDRGGDRDTMARINAAWSWLKAAKGWS